MSAKVYLFSWDRDTAASRSAALSASGFEVRSESEDGARGYGDIQREPPDVVVFDLARRPSHSRETARALHDSGRTRTLPLIFVDGDPAERERVSAAVPNATFTSSDLLVQTLQRLLGGRPPGRAEA
jgi:DNA-binding NarL/FixJ family response regulator